MFEGSSQSSSLTNTARRRFRQPGQLRSSSLLFLGHEYRDGCHPDPSPLKNHSPAGWSSPSATGLASLQPSGDAAHGPRTHTSRVCIYWYRHQSFAAHADPNCRAPASSRGTTRDALTALGRGCFFRGSVTQCRTGWRPQTFRLLRAGADNSAKSRRDPAKAPLTFRQAINPRLARQLTEMG